MANVRRRASATMLILVAIGAMYVVEIISGGPGSLMTGPIDLEAHQPRCVGRGGATAERRHRGHRGRSELAARDGHVPARGSLAHRVQRVRAVDLRLDGRTGARTRAVPVDLLRHGDRGERGLIRVRPVLRRGRRCVRSDLRGVRSVRHLQLPATPSRDRHGTAPLRTHAHRDQRRPRGGRRGDRLASARRRVRRRGDRWVRGRGRRQRCRSPVDPGRRASSACWRSRPDWSIWQTNQLQAQFGPF